MLRIGLTGGIGSGKTTVARIFETLGIPVYYADDAAKRLMNQDPALRTALIETFGPLCYKEGVLDRSYLASLVFEDESKREQLNQLVHPATIADANEWLSKQQAPYALREAALLFESGAAEGLDYVIGVSAPAALRLQRVMQRDQLSEAAVKKRMATQLQDAIKLKLCDFVIVNDERVALLPQVLDLHEKLTALAAQPMPH
ncbi:MAG: dephospho-CoA kinase [Sphingomonadales bacterium]|nr:dephospho-CoA kinase [Sphingomonadales bacterium]